MTGLFTMGADWAEGSARTMLNGERPPHLRTLRYGQRRGANPSATGTTSLNDTSEAWQDAVMAALADFETHSKVSIETLGGRRRDRDDVVATDETGTYAINKVTFATDRKGEIHHQRPPRLREHRR